MSNPTATAFAAEKSPTKLDPPRVRNTPDVLLWSIDVADVDWFCADNDEPRLSDDEMDQLFDILSGDYDRWEVVAEAIANLCNGTRRFGC
jgi:hypothetical protein